MNHKNGHDAEIMSVFFKDDYRDVLFFTLTSVRDFVII